MLNEVDINVRVDDGVDLFKMDWVQSVNPGRNFHFNRGQGTFFVVQLYEEKTSAKSVSNGVQTSGVQREVFASSV